jgi:hypothetical protein
VSRDAKAKIAATFASEVADPTDDVDRDLAQIRNALGGQFGDRFDFHDPAILNRWMPTASPWHAFVTWGNRMVDTAPEYFERDERSYKLTTASNLADAREKVLQGAPDWFVAVKKAFGPPNNLTPWQVADRFKRWCQADPDAALQALQGLWAPGRPVNERLG